MFLVGLTALLTALVVQSGELGSIDTARRLQTTHSFWTSAPPVAAGDFGLLVGRGGRLYSWYGIGQSLVMLPADIVATLALKFIARFRELPESLREVFVSYTTSTLVCILAIWVCFRFLTLLAFTVEQAILGAFTLLFGTTFLHYTQNMMENNLILLLTLTGFCFQYNWFRNGSARSLLWGSIAFGANLLTRITTGLDLLAGALFIVLCLWYDNIRGRAMIHRLIQYGRVCLPCYAVFLLIERLYYYYRFGAFYSLYPQIMAAQKRQLNPSLPPDFPWNNPFWKGFLGPLITAEKSIFLFDPLILLTLVLIFFVWKYFASEIKAYVISLVWLLFACIALYAKWFDWSGDYAWGDRFVTAPVQLLAMISTPLMLRHRSKLKGAVRRLGTAIALISVIIQIASVVFWHPLEIHQMQTLGHPRFVVGLRFLNIIALATGMRDKWSLNNRYTLGHIQSTTPYFWPFLLLRTGTVSLWKVSVLIAGWVCLLGTLIGLLFVIAGKIRAGVFGITPENIP